MALYGDYAGREALEHCDLRLAYSSLNVIASEAKQSNFLESKLDCFVASAPRNDGDENYFPATK